MRATKTAIAAALAADDALAALVPDAQVYAVERATVPQLPSIEVIGVSSERVGDGPVVRHTVSIECTAAHPTEDGCDSLLDSIVRAVRGRLSAAEHSERPIRRADGGNVPIVLGGTRWSISAANTSGIVRGASVTVTAEGGE